MSYCPNCRQRFEGVKECPTDRIALVDELPYQTVDGPTSTWVEIESASSDEEARLIQGFLETEGIPCQIESLKVESMPMTLGSMGEIRIYVTAENEQAALDILAERSEEMQGLAADGAVVTDEGPADLADDAEAVADTEES